MPLAAIKKDKSVNLTIVKKVSDYSKEPAFKKKAENALVFLQRHGLRKAFKKK